ncbi:MAG: universal stress protein [Myxococcales bacterium]
MIGLHSTTQPITKLVCPLDASTVAESALTRAVELARALGADVELLHVYQLSAFKIPKEDETLDYIENLKGEAQTYLNDVRARLVDAGLRVSTCLIEGDPAHAIVEHGKATPGCMLVMSTHGRTGIRRLVLGSVAEHVVREANVPVLTVHLD